MKRLASILAGVLLLAASARAQDAGAPPPRVEAPSFTFTKRRGGADARVAAIVERVKRHHLYPEVARRAGAEGVSTVSFGVLPNGQVHELRIKHTSGNALLDKAALEAVRKAAPLPPFDKTLVLRIRYTLVETPR